MDLIREKFGKNLLLQNLGAVFPILGISLDERPPIDITNVGFAIGSQQVEATNFLSKLLHNSVANKLLIRSKNNRISHLFTILIPRNNSVQSG